jgi:hypothetical protein
VNDRNDGNAQSPLPPPVETEVPRAGPLRAGPSSFEEAVGRVLALPLDAFADAGQPLKIRVPWWREPLYFVPRESDVGGLLREGVSRGAIWTGRELADLLTVPGITRAGARTVALAKLTIAGEVAEVLAATPTRCKACKGQNWWRSQAGRTVCATCHPPPAGAILPEPPR